MQNIPQTNAPLPPVKTVCRLPEQSADLDLHVINASMTALREIAALPEQCEFSLLRAMAHTEAINHACRSINARMLGLGAIEKARAA